MTRFHAVSLLVASAAAALVACSSSSSGATKTQFACSANDPMQRFSAACTSCAESKCASQVSDAYGPNFAQGDYSGGTCAPFVACISKCACGDTTCAGGCAQEGQTCLNAQTGLFTCAGQSCTSECVVVSGGDAGH